MSLSVVIPCWNAASFIGEAIDSVLPALSEWDEVLVQDGSSTDGTIDLLTSRYGHDARVRVISEPDGGQSDALNRAVRRARGDYLLWLNADDWVNAEGLTSALEVVRRESPDLVVGAHSIRRLDGSLISAHPARSLERRRLIRYGCYVFSGSLIVKREHLTSVGFVQDRHYAMDLDLMLSLVEVAPRQVVVPDEIGRLRWHDAAKSSAAGYRFVSDAYRAKSAHDLGTAERLTALGACGLHLASLVTTPVRHSSMYRRVRGSAGR